MRIHTVSGAKNDALAQASKALALWFRGFYMNNELDGLALADILQACQELVSHGYEERLTCKSLYRAMPIWVDNAYVRRFGRVKHLVSFLNESAGRRPLSKQCEPIASFTPHKLCAAIYGKYNLKRICPDDAQLEVGTLPVIVEVPIAQLKPLISMAGLVEFFSSRRSVKLRDAWNLRRIVTVARFKRATDPLFNSFWNLAWSNEVLCVPLHKVIEPKAFFSITAEYDEFHPSKLIALDPRVRPNKGLIAHFPHAMHASKYVRPNTDSKGT